MWRGAEIHVCCIETGPDDFQQHPWFMESWCVPGPQASRRVSMRQPEGCATIVYSSRSASSGEIRLARRAGINDAANADNPSVTTATNVTTGLYGLMP